MKKIGVLINPHAKSIKKMKTDPVEYFSKLGGEHALVRASDTLDQVYTIAEEFKKNKIAYLGICGGDGSLHHVISRFLYVYKKEPLPPVLILKGGTMNTISRTIHLKGMAPQIMKRMILAIENGDQIATHRRNTIKVYENCCFIFGVGITSNFLNEYYRGGDTGPVKAVKVVIKGLAGSVIGTGAGSLFERFHAKVIIDGKEVGFHDFLGVLSATVECVGIGFNLLFRAYEKEGAFHTLCAGMKPLVLAMNVLKLKNGKPIDHPHYYESLTRKMTIIGPKKFQYIMDGDLYEANTELTIEAGPVVSLVYV